MTAYTARVGMTVTNAQTGEPLEVDAEVAVASIAVRIGDTVVLVARDTLTLEQAGVLAGQLQRLRAR